MTPFYIAAAILSLIVFALFACPRDEAADELFFGPAPDPRTSTGATACLRVDGYPLSIGSEALPESPREHHARAAGADLSFHPSTDSAGEAREHA